MANLTINKDSGIAQPTKWYSNSKKLVIHLHKYHCCESLDLEAEKR